MHESVPSGLAGRLNRLLMAAFRQHGRERRRIGMWRCFRSGLGLSVFMYMSLWALFPGLAMGGTPEVCMSSQDDPIQAQSEFVMELRAVDDMPDAFSVICSLAFDPEVVSFKTLSRGFIGLDDKGRLDVNVPGFLGIKAGTVITTITWRAANPGQNVMEPVSCVYSSLSNKEAPLKIDPVQVNITGQYKVYGDIDGNGEVDGQDLYMLATHISGINCRNAEECTGDLNNNTRVNWEDVALFASGFGREDN